MAHAPIIKQINTFKTERKKALTGLQRILAHFVTGSHSVCRREERKEKKEMIKKM